MGQVVCARAEERMEFELNEAILRAGCVGAHEVFVL